MTDTIATQNEPLISVVMPVYNAAPYVGAAIESILDQTYSYFELLVVDDGSTDRSPAIMQEYAKHDRRVQLLSVPHGGQSAALNAGIRAAAGEYIALLDSDDLALPERLAVQLAWVQQTGVDVCGACVRRFDGGEQIIWFPETPAAVRAELLFRTALLPSTVFARAAVLKDNPYVPGLVGEDYEMWTRLAPRFRLGNVPRILAQYRTHEKQISRVQTETRTQTVRKCRRRYFAALFPDASEEDYDALSRVAENRPHSTLASLERAGQWLVRLADAPDDFLRAKLAQRWTAACRCSAHLGLSCFYLHQKTAVQFGPEIPADAGQLWLMCALRVGADSHAAHLWRRLKPKLLRKHRRKHHAPA